MTQEAVQAAINALLEDEQLVLDLSTIIEKAASKANVESLTAQDVSEIFTGLASAASSEQARFFRKFFVA